MEQCAWQEGNRSGEGTCSGEESWLQTGGQGLKIAVILPLLWNKYTAKPCVKQTAVSARFQISGTSECSLFCCA